jgi:hypothetical protein
MRAFIEGVGLAGPGLHGWRASREMLVGRQTYRSAPVSLASIELLPAAERRRVGVPVKLAIATGQEALLTAGRDAAVTATVLTSSSGDCENLHHILEALSTPDRQISPTRFHNSVHNAAAGYWSIAMQCRAPSTSLCCHDGSFAAGLLEAASQSEIAGAPVALIAYDHPYPQPLNSVRPIRGEFGVALVMAPQATGHAIAALEVEFVPRRADATRMADPELEALRSGVPAARSLPLLATLARGSRETVVLEYVKGAHLRVTVTPCA